MRIKTEIDPERIVDLRVALNSLQFTLDRLEILDKDNLAKVIYEGDRRSLAKARLALKELVDNS